VSARAFLVPPERRDFAWVYHTARNQRSQSRKAYLTAKRALDIAFVIATAPVWIPMITAGYIAVRLENPRAPGFFTQSRTGLHGRQFNIYKLRTMVPEAETMKAALMHLSDRDGPNFKLAQDPRITPVGRWLRRLYLDELPQVLNILAGHMSLVGPRPTTTRPEAFAHWQTGRLDQPPGLTCLWQIKQHRFPSFADRIRLDILYNRHSCFALDLRILARTARHLIFGGRGS
jgi:lipopolysaccharide/colanic/teichoic acid biosynthesis glycosyltransferase